MFCAPGDGALAEVEMLVHRAATKVDDDQEQQGTNISHLLCSFSAA
jgi:hypothetical protein